MICKLYVVKNADCEIFGITAEYEDHTTKTHICTRNEARKVIAFVTSWYLLDVDNYLDVYKGNSYKLMVCEKEISLVHLYK